MKEELIRIFKENPVLKKEEIAKMIKMDPGNFRGYVGDNQIVVTEKTYKKIKEGIDKAFDTFAKSLGKI